MSELVDVHFNFGTYRLPCLFCTFFQDDEDIEMIEDNPQVVPYLLVIKSRETMSYCVVVEKQPFMEPSTFSHAFVALVAAYYVF